MSANKRVFHAIDLDRTLLNTALLAQELENIVAERIPGFEKELHDQMAAYIQRGESFFIFEYFVSRHGLEAMQACVAELQKRFSQDDFLLPGARERLDFATSQPGWGVGIITYGSSITQKIKIHLCGLDSYQYYITTTPKKSECITSWQQSNGEFKLPEEFGGGVADVVVLDDDKFEAFQELPTNTVGNWLTTDPEAHDKISDELKSRVQPFTNLHAVIESLIVKLA